MENLIVAGIVLTVLLLSLILSKKDKQVSDWYLLLYLCFATLNQAYSYLETTSSFQLNNFMLLGRGLNLLNAPLFFMYIYTLLTSKKVSFKLALVLYVPFVAYVFHFFYYYIWVFNGASLSIQSGLLVINEQVSMSWLVFVVLFLIIEPIYLVWYHVLLRRYKRGLLNTVSNIDQIKLRWLYLLFYLWLISTIILVPLSTISVGIAWIRFETVEIMIQTASVAFFFILGYYGLKQTTVFTDLNYSSINENKKSRYQKSGLSNVAAEKHHVDLLTLMENNKPYLSGDLKASELAQLLNISVNHLSQVLNQIQNQNFFDFVNSYRIKEVKSKIEDPRNKHLTLFALALDSGFNSKTSFNTVFKKITHQTPSSYYKSVQKHD